MGNEEWRLRNWGGGGVRGGERRMGFENCQLLIRNVILSLIGPDLCIFLKKHGLKRI